MKGILQESVLQIRQIGFLIALIISDYFFGMALLSRDTHKPDIKCLLKLIYWKIVSFGFRPNC